jgi:hypothetical protein
MYWRGCSRAEAAYTHTHTHYIALITFSLGIWMVLSAEWHHARDREKWENAHACTYKGCCCAAESAARMEAISSRELLYMWWGAPHKYIQSREWVYVQRAANAKARTQQLSKPNNDDVRVLLLISIIPFTALNSGPMPGAPLYTPSSMQSGGKVSVSIKIMDDLATDLRASERTHRAFMAHIKVRRRVLQIYRKIRPCCVHVSASSILAWCG